MCEMAFCSPASDLQAFVAKCYKTIRFFLKIAYGAHCLMNDSTSYRKSSLMIVPRYISSDIFVSVQEVKHSFIFKDSCDGFCFTRFSETGKIKQWNVTKDYNILALTARIVECVFKHIPRVIAEEPGPLLNRCVGIAFSKMPIRFSLFFVTAKSAYFKSV